MKRPTRHRANSTRMGSQFAKRAEEGVLIDRADLRQREGSKNPKHLPVPEGLARFFKPVGEL